MMNLWHVYLRKGTVFVPTVARTEAGFFMDIDPVAVVNSTDRGGIIIATKSNILKGNPVISTPTRATFPKPVLLKCANVKSWATFEKNAFCWSISEDDSGFKLCPQSRNPSGGWEDDSSKIETFSGGTALDEVANALADAVQRPT